MMSLTSSPKSHDRVMIDTNPVLFFRLFQFGLSMILAASAATGDTPLVSSTISALGLAYAVHRFFIVEGNAHDSSSERMSLTE